jgi:hypothetical protein
MGNHEWCEGCHETDFHDGKACEEAYPESRKKVLAENAARQRERERGLALLEKFAEEMRTRGLDLSIDCGISIDKVCVCGFELARSEAKSRRDARGDMELTSEEIIALFEYHQNLKYETASREDYSEADYHKRRANEWAALKGEKFVVTPDGR